MNTLFNRYWASATICILFLISAHPTFAQQWNIQTVDSEGGVGLYTSIDLDHNGYPHISYYDLTNKDLKYACWDGSSWKIETVDSEGDVGDYTSIDLDHNGYPHISYRDASNDDLKYASWNGSSWNTQTVDSEGGGVGNYTSIALDQNGYPHISYYDATNYDLKYASWDGSSWKIATVDSGWVNQYTSIALDPNGYPHISYYDFNNKDLKYASWDGSSWEIETVDSKGNVGSYTSIALDQNGYPHISYYDSPFNEDLKYASWDGSSWEIETVDSEGIVGWYTSIALDQNGYPHISYYYVMTDNYEETLDLKCASWDGSNWKIETVDSEGRLGGYTSIALDQNGYPHISYYDDDPNYALKYAFYSPEGVTLTADFSGTPTSGTAPLDVQFTDESTGSPTSWSWDFDNDGTADATTQNPSHTYTDVGTYTVSLTVSDGINEHTETKTDYITVSEPSEVKTLLEEGFEETVTGWTVYDNDGDGNAWSTYEDTSAAHSGQSGVGVYYNANGNDDWLITPQLSLPSGSTVTFSFWAHSGLSSFLEDFNVKLSTTGIDISDFTVVLDEVTDVPYEWEEYSYDLSNYGGQSVYLAVQCVSVNDYYLFADDFLVTVSGGEIAIDGEHPQLPEQFVLFQNYPNPFNPVTTLRYGLPERSNVKIIIFDILGREVRTLAKGIEEPGFKTVIWDGTNDLGEPLTAGVYIYQIQAGEFIHSRKMVLLK